MKVLAILERSSRNFRPHTLCYVNVNRAGENAFNGIEKTFFLLSPGEKEKLPEESVGFILPKDALKMSYFLSPGEDVLFRIFEGTPLPRLIVEQGGFVSISNTVRLLRPISVGILTVSDKGSRGEREDLSGPALARGVKPLGMIVKNTTIVPDEIGIISETLSKWSDTNRLNLILTTGGTGLSKRDVTPEALLSIAEKHVPGFGETMRSVSMKITSKAMLSRGCAVVRGETLIIALPGSEKAAEECFAAIAPALRHGIEILCGWDGECGSHPHHHGAVR